MKTEKRCAVGAACLDAFVLLDDEGRSRCGRCGGVLAAKEESSLGAAAGIWLMLLLLALVTACGQDDKAAVSAQPTPAPAPVVVVATPSPSYHSMAVADAEALPPCTADADGWLVYVRATAELEACEAGAWTVVPMPKGEKGDTGAVGAQGIAGAKGDTGETGATGAAGKDGVDATAPGLGDVWTDPDTGERWMFASELTDFQHATCPAGFALPTTSLPFAFVNYFIGYISTLPAASAYWTSIVIDGIGHVIRTVNTNGQQTSSANDTADFLVICKGAPL